MRRCFGTLSMVLLTWALVLALSGRPARGSGTIYIRSDGSVDPPTAPIQRSGDLYTFTADIYDSIVIQKDYVTVDGDGFKLEGTGSGVGFEVHVMQGVSILETTITGFSKGVYILVSGSAQIIGNTLTNNGVGIEIIDSSSCNIIDNTLSDNVNAGIRFYSIVTNSIVDGNSIQNSDSGIAMEATIEISSNTFVYNLIAHNDVGVRIDSTAGTVQDNNLYHNNFIDNTQQVTIFGPMPGTYPPNTWDSGYPSGGNYWSEYTDEDHFRGPNQDETGSDGIWDHPYVIATSNVDRYPFTQQNGWENPPPPPPPPLPEFPSDVAFVVAFIPMILYLYWKKKHRGLH